MNLMTVVEKELGTKTEFPKFIAGDTVTVHYKIIEGNKERIQQFRGVVIQRVRNWTYRDFYCTENVWKRWS